MPLEFLESESATICSARSIEGLPAARFYDLRHASNGEAIGYTWVARNIKEPDFAGEPLRTARLSTLWDCRQLICLLAKRSG